MQIIAHLNIKLWKKFSGEGAMPPYQIPPPLEGTPLPKLHPSWPAATRSLAPTTLRSTVPPALPVRFNH